MSGTSSAALDSLFEAIREECDPGIWSRAVTAARSGAVHGERESDDEIVLRVSTHQGLVAPTVRLYPDEDEWDCDCAGPANPCEHVAAAAIALRQARKDGKSLPRSVQETATIGYRLARRPGGLGLERVAVTPSAEVPLRGSLAGRSSNEVNGARLSPTPADLRLEHRLGSRFDGPVPRGIAARLLGLLAECEDVRFEGEPIETSTEPVLPLAIVEDRGDGFLLSVCPARGVDEAFENGIARCGRVLRPVGEPRLTLREREELPRGRYFAPDDAGLLASSVLPDLEARLPVEIRTQRLPSARRERPRIQLSLRRDGDSLAVQPEIVYGDPPCARIAEGRLVHVQGPVPIRDLAAEEQLVRRLERELALAPEIETRLDPEPAIALAERLATFDAGIQGDAHREFFRAPPLEASLRLDPGAFGVELATTTANGRRAAVDPTAALRAWRAGESLVPLEGGGFAALPTDWLARFGSRVADLLAARDAQGKIPPCVLPDLGQLCRDLGEPEPPALERLRVGLDGFERIPAAPLPADLRAELRPYQRAGVNWLGFLRGAGLGGLLADDMGLGKTLQALCAVRRRTLVVAPTSVLPGWAEQAERFRPSLRISVYHGPKRALDPQADLTITSYAILRLDVERLAAIAWDTVVLDEAQAIKNPDSQAAQAAHRLRASFRLTMTGTPVENRLEELWSQLAFSNPGLLGSLADFQERYAQPIARGEPGAAARLRERIAPFVLRRLKREVARDLPPRTEVALYCELSDEERAVYDTVRAATRSEVVERLRAGGSVLEALEALLRLRQASCHAGLVPGQHAERSSKLDLLLETLDEALAEGHKALVFSQWTSLLDRVEPVLREAAIEFARLDGSTVDRGAVVERFQATDGPPVLLVSLRAGGTGLNLTAADHVFLLDPWWNPAVEDQAADRAHRIGQDRPVLVHRLVARDTVEERILALQAEKRALAEAALSGADRAAALTRDDLLALLDA